MSTLYLVGTPIGNLEDISPRALGVLREVTLIAAEDTRTAKQLLAHFDIHTPVTSYYEHNKLTKLDRILDALRYGDVAVISEAGMPGLSDPGYELVRAALAQSARVSPVPGPSSVLAALVASGIAADQFYYLGFLPRVPQARRKLLRQLANESLTLIAFEAPHRLRATLQDLEGIFGSREICVARELTKVFEEFRRGPIPEVRRYFEATEPRGEFTLVIAGTDAKGTPNARTRQRVPQNAARRKGKVSQDESWDVKRVRDAVKHLLKQGVPRTQAVKRVARDSRRERREVYELTIKESR